jgi:hypothetical protein
MSGLGEARSETSLGRIARRSQALEGLVHIGEMERGRLKWEPEGKGCDGVESIESLPSASLSSEQESGRAVPSFVSRQRKSAPRGVE